MYRPNLLRCVTTIWTALACCSISLGQMHQRGNWHPGMHVPQSQYAAPILDYNVGQRPKVWDDQQPIEQMMTAVAQRSWLRFEYLHWTMSRPGAQPIGAPVLNQPLPEQFIGVNNVSTAAIVAPGIASIPQTGNLALDDLPGFRGTWGVDLSFGEAELQVFGLTEKADSFEFPNIQAGRLAGLEATGTLNRPNIVTPLLTNGVAADATAANYLVYDDSFSVNLKSQMWGAEASVLSTPYYAGEGIDWQWLGGFRYLAHEEEFGHRGTYNNGGALITPEVTTIGASTINNMYGPELGARASVKNEWISLSVTPRVAFTLNDYTAETFSTRVTDAGTVGTRVGESDIEFTPIVQLSFTGEINVTPNFSVFGGYDFMWIYRMTRPFDNIVYNSVDGAAGSVDPSIEQAVDLESFYTRGFSIGCAFTY